jgi:hypothetical protein
MRHANLEDVMTTLETDYERHGTMAEIGRGSSGRLYPRPMQYVALDEGKDVCLHGRLRSSHLRLALV